MCSVVVLPSSMPQILDADGIEQPRAYEVPEPSHVIAVVHTVSRMIVNLPRSPFSRHHQLL